MTTSENKKIDGWYLEPEYKTEKKTGQTKLTDVKGNAVDKVITFYGRTETPGVAVSKAITSVERNGQSLDAVPETLQVGDIVT